VASGPIIVVSDTHIGLQKRTPKRFAHFLAWVNKGFATGRLPIVTLEGERKHADPPEKLILLGDFFELWGPLLLRWDDNARIAPSSSGARSVFRCTYCWAGR
jgi:hypothetical protein